MESRQFGTTKHREITSTANPLLKVFRHALVEGVTRDGWLAVEGPHAIEGALAAGPRAIVQSVLVTESALEKLRPMLQQVPGEAEVAVVSDQLFARVAATPSPQGVAALVELIPHDLDAALRRRDALVLIACGLQDPGNLGAMMRSAQALGGTALVTLKETVSPFNPKATRSSAGSVFHLPIFPGLDATHLFVRLGAAGIQIVAADRESADAISEADLKGPVAFLIGKEASGLPEEIAERAHLKLSIPIRPSMDSVNAATAASIFLYEAARQREFEGLGD